MRSVELHDKGTDRLLADIGKVADRAALYRIVRGGQKEMTMTTTEKDTPGQIQYRCGHRVMARILMSDWPAATHLHRDIWNETGPIVKDDSCDCPRCKAQTSYYVETGPIENAGLDREVRFATREEAEEAMSALERMSGRKGRYPEVGTSNQPANTTIKAWNEKGW